jgi:predicted transposase/invertase (TIGR01784 family)
MQVIGQKFFVQRVLFYLSMTMGSLAKKGLMEEAEKKIPYDFNLPRLYSLSFCNFEMELFQEPCTEVVQHILFSNAKHPEVKYKHLMHMVFVILPRFTKPLEECKDNKDLMLYAIKHAHEYEYNKLPKEFDNWMFKRLFDLAEIAKFTPQEVLQYKRRQMTTGDYQRGLLYAEEKGETRGSLRQAQAMARRMLADNEPIDKIERYTGLSEPEILSLEDEN